MDVTNEPAREPTPQGEVRPEAASVANVRWMVGPLALTAAIGVLAKILGVIVVPGLRGLAKQHVVVVTETAAALVAYLFALLLVALVAVASFELARLNRVSGLVRSVVVGSAGLLVALAAPAIVQRIPARAAIALAIVTSIVAFVAGATAARTARTRALGTVVAALAFAGLLRAIGWLLAAVAGQIVSLDLYLVARGFSTAAVAVQALATLVAAAWIGTRSAWRGRMLANGAIIAALALTYLAAREEATPPPPVLAVLRRALGAAAGVPTPFALESIAAFLLPASLLLAIVALVQRAPRAIVGSLALALVAQGSFDVPLQAIAMATAAQWTLLAMVDERAMWAPLLEARGQRLE